MRTIWEVCVDEEPEYCDTTGLQIVVRKIDTNDVFVSRFSPADHTDVVEFEEFFYCPVVSHGARDRHKIGQFPYYGTAEEANATAGRIKDKLLASIKEILKNA